MAPVQPRFDHDRIEQQLKETIQTLYQILVQVSSYDTSTSRATRDVLAAELRSLSAALAAVHRTATTPDPATALPSVPPELVQYVENGRNPDIYTREFAELVRRGNQLVKGKMGAFAGLRDELRCHVDAAMPELRPETARVAAATTLPPYEGGGRGGDGANPSQQQVPPPAPAGNGVAPAP